MLWGILIDGKSYSLQEGNFEGFRGFGFWGLWGASGL